MTSKPKLITTMPICLILSSAIYHTTFSYQCPQGDWPNERYYIKNAIFVNTTVERYSKLQSTECTWKFSIKLKSDKIPKLICLMYDLGRGPALKDSRLVVYGSNFRNIKVVRPLMKLAPFLFSGSVVGDPDSAAFGTIARGGFLGQLRTGRQVFHIEKAIKYFPPTKYSKGPSVLQDSNGGAAADANIQILFESKDLHVLCTHRNFRSKREDNHSKSFKHVSSDDNNENYSEFDELDEDTVLSEAYVHATVPPSVKGSKKGHKIFEKVTNALQNRINTAHAPSVSNNSNGPGTDKVNEKEHGRHEQGTSMGSESEQLTLIKGNLSFTPASYDHHSPINKPMTETNLSVVTETTTNPSTTEYGDSFTKSRKPSAYVETEYDHDVQAGVNSPSDGSSKFIEEHESNNEAHDRHQSQSPLSFFTKNGLIWKLTLACDYEFYRDGGDENIGITVGRMLHVFYLAEWVFRSTDWNGDQLPDNLGFKIENVVIEIEPSDSNGGAERFTLLTKDCSTPLILAFSSKFTPIQHVFTETRKNESVVNPDGCDNETKIFIISVVDSTSKELPDSIIVQRIINAILRFLGSDDEGIKQKCEDSRSANETRRWDQYGINECVIQNLSAHILASVCPTEPDIAFCGNGILEAGEECDCGSLSSCWMSQGGCCNPRGNSLSQCKFASDAECFDPTGLCCDVDNCQRKDISNEGLSCESPPVCAVVANLTDSIVENVSSSCGALVAGNIAQIQTECVENLCQSNECTRLGLSECWCTAESVMGQIEMHCVTCCQLPDKRCLTAEAATEAVLETLSRSYENYTKENFLLSNREILLEFMGRNKDLKAFWDKLKVESVTKTSEGPQLRSPVDEIAMTRRLCLFDFQPETCVNVSFLRWPVGRLCVVHGAVSTCTADRLCKIMYQNSMMRTKEVGQLYQTLRRDDNILNVGSILMSPSGLLVTYVLVFVSYGCTGHSRLDND